MDPQQPPAPAPAPATWQAPVEDAGPAPGVRFASHGGRLLAYIIDLIIVCIAIFSVSIVFGILLAGAAASRSGGAAIGGGLLWFLAVIVISVVYFPWFWTRGGQTPGMKVFHLRVVRDADGGPISTTSAVLRLVGYWVNGAVFYIGFIWIFIDKRRRGWHDLIAGTVVIETN
jgi:uncharacterized RDD family membrane protein YckC